MQRVGQDMHLRVAPFYKLAVEPDLSVAIVIATGHGVPPCQDFGCGVGLRDRKLRFMGQIASASLLECQQG